MRQEDYLEQAGRRAPLFVARLIGQRDWLGFEQRYAATRRTRYAQRLMMGRILYGGIQEVLSLRELE